MKTITIKIPWRLHPGQMKVAKSRARFKVLCCGRRWGKTVLVAYLLFKKLYPKGRALKPMRAWIVAPTNSLTKEVEAYFYKIIKPLIVRHNKTERVYELIGGHKIELRSAESQTLKGAGLDILIIDEAADVPDERWEKELRPTLIDTLGDVIIISTPEGRNWFYKMFRRGQDPEYQQYESWQCPSHDNPHLNRDELAEVAKDMPELIYQQEILAQFTDDNNNFFRNFMNCVYRAEEKAQGPIVDYVHCPRCNYDYKREIPTNGEPLFCLTCREEMTVPQESKASHYTGIDLAQLNDFTVLTTLRYHPKKKTRVVAIDRFNQISYVIQKDRIKTHALKYPGQTYLEMNGPGLPILDDLTFTGLPFNGIQMTAEIKARMLKRLAILFERELIEIPNHPVLLKELDEFQATRTPGGVWKYGAPDGEGHHDDCVMSLAMAVYNLPIVEA